MIKGIDKKIDSGACSKPIISTNTHIHIDWNNGIHVLVCTVKIIESYEIELAGMKKNLDNVMEENAYFKRMLNNQNISNDKDSDYEKE